LQTLNLEWKQNDTFGNKTLIYKHQIATLKFRSFPFENLVNSKRKTQVAYRLLGTKYRWKFQFLNLKTRMETWQIWNGKLKLETRQILYSNLWTLKQCWKPFRFRNDKFKSQMHIWNKGVIMGYTKGMFHPKITFRTLF